AQSRADAIHQRKAQVGMQQAEEEGRSRMAHQSMHHAHLAAPFGESVAMDRAYLAASHVQVEASGSERDPGFLGPEGRAPPVVISSDQVDRQSARKGSKAGSDPERMAGDDPAIAEPEVEQVAHDEQPVAQVG